MIRYDTRCYPPNPHHNLLNDRLWLWRSLAVEDCKVHTESEWKCSYVECSARFNWRVVALFRELMKAVDQSRIRLRAGGVVSTAAEPPSSAHLLSTYLPGAGGGGGPGGTSTNQRTCCPPTSQAAVVAAVDPAALRPTGDTDRRRCHADTTASYCDLGVI